MPIIPCLPRPVKGFVSYPVGNLSGMLCSSRVLRSPKLLCGLDLDGVVCDLGPPVAARIARRFGVATHPSTWSRYDLRLLELGLPHAPFVAFLEETFSDPSLYEEALPNEGACFGV